MQYYNPPPNTLCGNCCYNSNVFKDDNVKRHNRYSTVQSRYTNDALYRCPKRQIEHPEIISYVKNSAVIENVDTIGDAKLYSDIILRKVTLENATSVPVDVAIVPYQQGNVPQPKFTILPGQVLWLSINPIEYLHQFVWLFDHDTKEPVNDPHILSRHANTFVLHKGINGWMINDYRTIRK